MSERMNSEWWREMFRLCRERLARRSLELTCPCGQEVIVMGEGRDAAISAFIAEIGSYGQLPILEMDENATCPNCGALVFSTWKALIFLHLGDTIQEAMNGPAGQEQIEQALLELQEQLAMRREWKARRN